MTTSSHPGSAKTTIKVGLPPAESSLTRIVLGKKRPAEKKNEGVKVRIRAGGEENGEITTIGDKGVDTPRGDITADTFLPLEPPLRKRRELPTDDLARQQIINKILTDSSKKLKKKANDLLDPSRPHRQSYHPRPDPPCVRLVSKREGSFLSVPSAIDVRKLLNSIPPRPIKTPENCLCGSQGKYKDPKTGRRFCSVKCFGRVRSE